MKTKLTYDEIVERWKQAKDKWKNNKLIYFSFGSAIHKPLVIEDDYVGLEKKVAEMFNNYRSNISFPFSTNLALWMKMKRAGN